MQISHSKKYIIFIFLLIRISYAYNYKKKFKKNLKRKIIVVTYIFFVKPKVSRDSNVGKTIEIVVKL